MKTKQEICVPIRDEKELQQAKEMLERNGEKIDEKVFYISVLDENFLQYSSFDKDWFLGYEDDLTEIPLSELESVLRGESESKNQSSIEWIIDQMQSQQNLHTFDREDWLKVFEKAKQMHREEIEEAYNKGAVYDNSLTGVTSDEYYNETFNND